MRRRISHALMFIAAALAVFLFSEVVDAKSGCCSHHGGVDCSAGAQANGHVICYDGWRGSSCLYSEMIKCGGSSSSTTQYQPSAPIIAPEIPVVTPAPSPSPKLAPMPSPKRFPSPSPEVLGEEEKSKSTRGELGGAALLGYVIWRAVKKRQSFRAK